MTSKPQITFSRPRDESLEAYVDWIKQMTAALGGDAEAEGIPEEEWIDGWRKFWGYQ